MLRLPSRFLPALALPPLLAPTAVANEFATQVVSFSQGTGGGLFDTQAILGGPQGAGLSMGSLDVLTLGEGGSVVLGFDVDIVDGPGADFTVFENSFLISASDQTFAELLYVEVSTNGTDFARFGPTYTGVGSELGAFAGLAGCLPVLANVLTDPASPFVTALAGGESFDLADLATHPAVVSGLVDPNAIRFVRLVDCLPGDLDQNGTMLPGLGGADVDAVAVLNSDATDPSTVPTCDLTLDGAGRIVLTLGDPQGIGNLDLATLKLSFDLVEFPLTGLFPLFQLTSFGPTEAVLTSPPIFGTGFVSAFAASVSDLQGGRSGDQVMLQG